jgi:hypothetical protein
LVFLLLAIPAWAACPSTSNGYSYCRKFVINPEKVAGNVNLTNFPVLVSLTATWLKTTVNGGKLQDGNDLRFELSDGTTVLAHEIEWWDGATGRLVAWVLLPAVNHSADTVFYAYYGKAGVTGEENPAMLWADYLYVYHMDTDPGGATPQMLNSVSSTKDARSGGNMTSDGLVDGMIGKGWSFDGLDDYAEIDDETATEEMGTGAVSLWVKIDAYPWWGGLFVSRDPYDGEFLQFGTGGGSNLFVFTKDAGPEVGRLYATTSTAWQYVTAVWTSTSLSLFVDTTDSGAAGITDGKWSNSAKLRIADGQQDTEARNTDSWFDEIRVRISPVTFDWHITERENHTNPSAFYAVGADDAGGDPSVIPAPAFQINGVIGDD